MRLVVIKEFIILKDSKFIIRRQLKTKFGKIRNKHYDATNKLRETNIKLI